MKWLLELLGKLDDFRKQRGLSELSVGLFYVSLRTGATDMPSTAPIIATPAADPSNVEEPRANVSSPMVGVVYLAPAPDKPSFVNVGDHVKERDPLLIIEAMKVMNQIVAPKSGRVARIFVSDGEPVEYDAPLMLIE